MRCNDFGFLKIRFIGVLLTVDSVRKPPTKLCRVDLTRQMSGWAEFRCTRNSQEVGIVSKCMPTESPNSDLFSRAQQPATLCAPRVRGHSRTFTSEHPLAFLKRGRKRSPIFSQKLL